MKRSSVRIAIQKSGRLRLSSENLLKTWGISCTDLDDNKLVIPSGAGKFEVLLVRYSDIPKYVESGVADFGIIGENVLFEEKPKVSVLKKLGFGKCRLVIAAPKDSSIRAAADLEGERIATSYPNSLRKFLRTSGVSATVVNVNGGVEATPMLGLADAVCDIAQTGRTLEANGLRVVTEVLSSTAVLIESPNLSKAAYKFKTENLEN